MATTRPAPPWTAMTVRERLIEELRTDAPPAAIPLATRAEMLRWAGTLRSMAETAGAVELARWARRAERELQEMLSSVGDEATLALQREGLTLREIASLLGVSKNRVNNALVRLRARQRVGDAGE